MIRTNLPTQLALPARFMTGAEDTDVVVSSFLFPKEKANLRSVSSTIKSAVDTHDPATYLQHVHSTKVKHAGVVTASSLFGQGKLVSAGMDNTAKCWDIQKGLCAAVSKGRHLKAIKSVASCEKGQFFVTGSEDKKIKAWDIHTGQLLRTFVGHSKGVLALVVGANGRLVSGSRDCTAKVWDLTTGECQQTLSGHTNTIKAIDLMPDGRVVTGSSDKTAKLWDPVTGECHFTFADHDSPIQAVAVICQRWILTGAANGTVKSWDALTGQTKQTMHCHGSEVSSLAVMSQGRFAAGFADNAVKIWNWSTGCLMQTLRSNSCFGIVSVASCQNAEQIVALSKEGFVNVWHTKKLGANEDDLSVTNED